MVPDDFPMQRLIYLIVYKAPSGTQQFFKVGCSQKCYQRIGRNYLQGTGANTGWLAPSMHEFLKEFKGEFEIYSGSGCLTTDRRKRTTSDSPHTLKVQELFCLTPRSASRHHIMRTVQPFAPWVAKANDSISNSNSNS